jgi:hypothetical protein
MRFWDMFKAGFAFALGTFVCLTVLSVTTGLLSAALA